MYARILITITARRSRRDARRKFIGPWCYKKAWPQHERKGDIRHSGADISKIRKNLGYAPEYDFAKGIKEAIQWYKENL